MDISKGSSNGKHGANGGEGLVDGKDLFRAGVQLFRVDGLVVDTIFFSSGDTNLHFEPDLHGRHALEVLNADGNVVLIWFFRQIEHVGGVEGLTVLSEVGLVGLHHAVEPWEKLLGAVVRVENDGDTVVGCHGTNVEGQSDGSGSACVGVLAGFAGVKLAAAIRDLDHDW